MDLEEHGIDRADSFARFIVAAKRLLHDYTLFTREPTEGYVHASRCYTRLAKFAEDERDEMCRARLEDTVLYVEAAAALIAVLVNGGNGASCPSMTGR